MTNNHYIQVFQEVSDEADIICWLLISHIIP